MKPFNSKLYAKPQFKRLAATKRGSAKASFYAPSERERKMQLQVKASTTISSDDREDIEDAMSREMGSYIVSTGKTDFAEWSKEEWAGLVKVAFETGAMAVFTRRISVTEPTIVPEEPVKRASGFIEDEIPF